MFKKLLLSGALAVGLAAPAFASDVIVSGYNPIDSAGYTSFNIGGYGYYAGPIVLATNQGNLLTYCIDLFHGLSGNGHYNYATFTKDGNGVDLDPAKINHIAAIANWALTSELRQRTGSGGRPARDLVGVEDTASPPLSATSPRRATSTCW